MFPPIEANRATTVRQSGSQGFSAVAEFSTTGVATALPAALAAVESPAEVDVTKAAGCSASGLLAGLDGNGSLERRPERRLERRWKRPPDGAAISAEAVYCPP